MTNANNLIRPTLLEAVPNISSGANVLLADGLADAARGGIDRGRRIDGSHAELVDVHRDADHDRSVLTIIGHGEALALSLVDLALACVERLDIHADRSGVHPRIGALDVLPIIPVPGQLDEEGAANAAHSLVRRLGAAIGELGVPVVHYGLAEDGRPLPGSESTGAIRRGGIDAVAARIESGALELLGGPAIPHPSAGVTMCGVRDVLIAFNVELDTTDVDVAREIAAQIRDAVGGPNSLPGVRALGLGIESRGVVQVSTNIDRHAECGPARVLEHVAHLASARDVPVSRAELVGLAPDSALVPLRYVCTRLGIPLAATADPSLDAAIGRVRDASRH